MEKPSTNNISVTSWYNSENCWENKLIRWFDKKNLSHVTVTVNDMTLHTDIHRVLWIPRSKAFAWYLKLGTLEPAYRVLMEADYVPPDIYKTKLEKTKKLSGLRYMFLGGPYSPNCMSNVVTILGRCGIDVGKPRDISELMENLYDYSRPKRESQDW